MLILQVPSSSRGISPEDFFPDKSGLQPEGLLPARGMAGSGLRHCPKFPTAASRRSLGRVSVPVWLVVLSDQLQIVGLVSFYPTNYLICHRPLRPRKALRSPAFIRRSYAVLAKLSLRYPPRSGTFRCITHPFATRQHPKTCYRSTCMCKACRQRSI